MTEQTPETPPGQTPPEVVSVTPKKSPLLVILLVILGLIIVAGAVYAGISIGKKQSQLNIVAEPTITPQTTEVSSTPDPTADWKTYTSKYGRYSFKYPQTWYLSESNDTEDALNNPAPENAINSGLKTIDKIEKYNINVGFLNVGVFKIDTRNKNIEFGKETLGQWGKENGTLTKVTFNGAEGYKLAWVYKVPVVSATRVAYFLEKDGLFYDIELSVNDGTQNTESLYNEGNQILSTFKFTNEDNTVEGRFCGGIAANLPQNQCPEGYTCKLDGDYPDASGKCVKN